jgi:hypothetical protein
MDSVADLPCPYCKQADPLTLGRGPDTTVYCGNCGTLLTPPARERLPDDQLPCNKCHRRIATDRVPLAAGSASYCPLCTYVVRRVAWQETVRRFEERYGPYDPTPPDRPAKRHRTKPEQPVDTGYLATCPFCRDLVADCQRVKPTGRQRRATWGDVANVRGVDEGTLHRHTKTHTQAHPGHVIPRFPHELAGWAAPGRAGNDRAPP